MIAEALSAPPPPQPLPLPGAGSPSLRSESLLEEAVEALPSSPSPSSPHLSTPAALSAACLEVAAQGRLVFIGGCGDADAAELRLACAPFGAVTDALPLLNPDGDLRGCGLVAFSSAAEAQRLLTAPVGALAGKSGRPWGVRPAQGHRAAHTLVRQKFGAEALEALLASSEAGLSRSVSVRSPEPAEPEPPLSPKEEAPPAPPAASRPWIHGRRLLRPVTACFSPAFPPSAKEEKEEEEHLARPPPEEAAPDSNDEEEWNAHSNPLSITSGGWMRGRKPSPGEAERKALEEAYCGHLARILAASVQPVPIVLLGGQNPPPESLRPLKLVPMLKSRPAMFRVVRPEGSTHPSVELTPQAMAGIDPATIAHVAPIAAAAAPSQNAQAAGKAVNSRRVYVAGGGALSKTDLLSLLSRLADCPATESFTVRGGLSVFVTFASDDGAQRALALGSFTAPPEMGGTRLSVRPAHEKAHEKGEGRVSSPPPRAFSPPADVRFSSPPPPYYAGPGFAAMPQPGFGFYPPFVGGQNFPPQADYGVPMGAADAPVQAFLAALPQPAAASVMALLQVAGATISLPVPRAAAEAAGSVSSPRPLSPASSEGPPRSAVPSYAQVAAAEGGSFAGVTPSHGRAASSGSVLESVRSEEEGALAALLARLSPSLRSAVESELGGEGGEH